MAEESRRPRGREKHVTGEGTGLKKRGDGLGTGPVGSKDGYAGKLSKQDRDLLSSLLSGAMGGQQGSSQQSAGMSDLMSLFGGGAGHSAGSSSQQNVSMQQIAQLLGAQNSSSYSSQQNIGVEDIMSILSAAQSGQSSQQNVHPQQSAAPSTVQNILGGGGSQQGSQSGLGGLFGGSGSQQSSQSGLGNLLGGGGSQQSSQSSQSGLGGLFGGASQQTQHTSQAQQPQGGQNLFSLGGGSGSGGSGNGGLTGLSGGKRRGSCLTYIIILVIVFFLLSFLMRSCSSGIGQSGSVSEAPTAAPAVTTPKPTAVPTAVPTQTPAQPAAPTQNASNSFYNGGTNSYTEWGNAAGNTAAVSEAVASGAREKRTQILGNGQDTVTIMIYMCGTDLESRSGMGTSDLMEMTKANIADNVNVIVFTGGCSKWNNSVISSSVNQIYQVKSGGLARLVENAGNAAMTSPSNLSEFIKWCAENFPANRNELILWDHGSGSVAGYGYDEKNKRSGSMSLAGISSALKDAGVTFDFVGFDACLMATAETAIMLDPYADYMIASEETEPGVGWYYTDWLSALSSNTSRPTLQVGKDIVDTFVTTCARKCQGQKTTLSVIDLAEYSATVPQKLNAFSRSISTMIEEKQYQQVSEARYKSREFAPSTRIDQVDLVDLALKMGTPEGKELAEVIRGAVKYNRTSNDMTNAYGCAIYFPYRRTEYVDAAVNTYSQIGMDTEYANCIKEVAGLTVSGQLAGGGYSSPFGQLLGGGSSSSQSTSSSDIVSLLSQFLGGDYSGMQGYSSENTGFFSGRSMSIEDTAEYVAENLIDPSELTWTQNDSGEYILSMSEKNWSLVRDLDLNIFFDDGFGYIDLGLDNIYDFDEEGNLIADTERTWLAINRQIVAYYRIDTVDDGENYKITGRVPVLLNGERADLLIVFDNDHPEGYVAGVTYEYAEDTGLTLIPKVSVAEADADVPSEKAELTNLDTGETEEVETDITSLRQGDKLDFICDYYSYDGRFEEAYLLGETMTVNGDLTVSDVTLPEGDIIITYRITDIYDEEYWTEKIEK
ncbi:MAG: peptidase C11 [Lachnospiraceae bacterium]|nr:peptidase C11 [Lachnospiraceae bacterium]